MLAFGDSITNGGGELQWGVALQSWALWVARALGLPFTSYAADGALVDDVVHRQIPAFENTAARPDARYELGCLYIGVNDVRALDWNPATFELGHRRALTFLSERCERVLTMTVPLDLGRPRAGARVPEINEVIERSAAAASAIVVDLRDFDARNLVMADHVHPTAFGQIAIAERALDGLAQIGLNARVAPHELIAYETTWWQRLRGDATYVYRHAKVSGRSLAIQLWLRAAGQPRQSPPANASPPRE